MADLLVIFGITGQQGGSVAYHALNDPEVSKRYKVRGVTRDTSKPKARALADKGVELVQGNIESRGSIRPALRGAHTVFAVTTSIYEPGGFEKEIQQGKDIADEAVAAGLQMIIYSTVPSPKKLTSGRFTVGSFDNKDTVKDYIESLPIKSAFFAPGGFMTNFQTFMVPRPGPDAVLALTNFVKPSTQLPVIDVAEDTGKFVNAILADPDKFAGKTFCAASDVFTMEEIAMTMSKVTGKEIRYNQVPKEVYAEALPESIRDTYVNMMGYFEDTGYFGEKTRELVKWAADNCRGKPNTLEDYLRREPLPI